MITLKNLSLRFMLGSVLAFSSCVAPIILPLGITALSVPQTACGPNTLQQTAEAAKDIGGGVRDVIKAVGQAYDKGLITLAQKDKYADLLSAIAKGGQHGVDVIAALQAQGVTTPNPTQAQQLSLVFTDEVVSPFLSFLTEIGKLSESSSAAIRAALVGVRTAIVLLSSRIGRNDVIRAIETRERVYA